MRLALTALALAILVTPAYAQEAETGGTIEELASDEELASVREAIGQINCDAEVAGKESDTLYEVDDAECEIGQYDIKLDADFNITSMTRDE
jgi:hypothetical protein